MNEAEDVAHISRIIMDDEDAYKADNASMVDSFCLEFGIAIADAVEMLVWIDKHTDMKASASSEVAEKLRELNSKFRQAIQILIAYQQNQKRRRPSEILMSTRVMAMALGFHSAADAQDASELGRKIGIGKATVNKCLNHFIERLKLPPLPTQRNNSARQNMKRARLKQLTP